MFRAGMTWTFILGLASVAWSAQGTASGPGLDQKSIHQKYNDGDFDAVIQALEAYKKANPNHPRADSIFIAKHLAVVYSANPLTREKGKYYMYQLLDLLPSAKLVDMYVSDEIDRIFDKVREEFITRQKAFGVDSTAVNLPPRAAAPEAAQPKPAEKKAAAAPPPPAPEKKAERGRKSPNTKYWVAGGAAVVAAGMATFFILSGGEPEDKVYVVR